MKSAVAVIVLLSFASCSNAIAQEAPVSTDDGAAAASDARSLVRHTLADTQFQQLFPGVAVHFAYGGIGLGVPTGQLGRIDAGLTFPAHTHSDDYRAVLIQGRFQNWEVGDADKGPVMTPGSTFFQGRNAAHHDSCLGPEPCLVYVTFAQRADVTMAQ